MQMGRRRRDVFAKQENDTALCYATQKRQEVWKRRLRARIEMDNGQSSLCRISPSHTCRHRQRINRRNNLTSITQQCVSWRLCRSLRSLGSYSRLWCCRAGRLRRWYSNNSSLVCFRCLLDQVGFSKSSLCEAWVEFEHLLHRIEGCWVHGERLLSDEEGDTFFAWWCGQRAWVLSQRCRFQMLSDGCHVEWSSFGERTWCRYFADLFR